jgi:hypothetical protein
MIANEIFPLGVIFGSRDAILNLIKDFHEGGQ